MILPGIQYYKESY